jgi:hypothetical protein
LINEVSNIITLQIRSGRGKPYFVRKDTVVYISSSPPSGKFDIRPDGTFNGSVTAVVIPKGLESVNFYYKDVLEGTKILSAMKKSTLYWKGASQTIEVKSNPEEVLSMGK